MMKVFQIRRIPSQIFISQCWVLLRCLCLLLFLNQIQAQEDGGDNNNGPNNDFTVINDNTEQDTLPEFMVPSMAPSSEAEAPDASSHTFVAGRIFPLFQGLKYILSQQEEIWKSLKDIFHIGDFIPLIIVGWLVIPIVDEIYQKIYLSLLQSSKASSIEDEHNETMPTTTSVRASFYDTTLYHVLHYMCGIARIGMLMYVIDLIGVIAFEISAIGTGSSFKRSWSNGLSQSIATVLYTMWVVDRFKRAKRYIVFKRIAQGPSADEGKAELVNHMLNALLYGIALVVLAQLLSFNMGIALSSLFAFGGSATLILSLASKDIAKELLSGLALTIGDEYHHGEEVILENGKGGFIQKIGWTHTLFRNYNELLVRIPNSKLHGQSIANLSRGKMSQVNHTLRIQHSDLHKIEDLIETIKEEVLKATAPYVITKGRPFRAHLRDINDDHLSVITDFHFNIPPTGEVYWNNRQKTLMAIERALIKHDISLVTSSYFGNHLNQRNY